jgi:carbonic anhydrase
MKGLLDPEELHHIPATARWLQYAAPALQLLNQVYTQVEGDERLKLLSQLNVLEQLAHLHTHPAVESRVQAGALGLHGWYYEIDKGRVEVFNPDFGQFQEWS